MIIQARQNSLLLITQPDHAALSGEIMQHWRDGGLPTHPRRDSILLAIREHDNGWRETDIAPLVDPATGGLLDFVNAPAEVRRAIWPRGVERLAENPWAAALVAQHAVHVYRRYREDPEWTSFFADLEARRDSHLERTGRLTIDDLIRDYFFVRMGDLLSLTFCNGWSEGPEHPGYTIQFSAGQLTVTPDAFEGRTWPLGVYARELRNHRFESPEQARAAFDAAPRTFLPCTFVGAV